MKVKLTKGDKERSVDSDNEALIAALEEAGYEKVKPKKKKKDK